jgi:hypothetical protein
VLCAANCDADALKTLDKRGATRSNVAHEIAGFILAWSHLEHRGTRWSTL